MAKARALRPAWPGSCPRGAAQSDCLANAAGSRRRSCAAAARRQAACMRAGRAVRLPELPQECARSRCNRIALLNASCACMHTRRRRTRARTTRARASHVLRTSRSALVSTPASSTNKKMPTYSPSFSGTSLRKSTMSRMPARGAGVASRSWTPCNGARFVVLVLAWMQIESARQRRGRMRVHRACAAQPQAATWPDMRRGTWWPASAATRRTRQQQDCAAVTRTCQRRRKHGAARPAHRCESTCASTGRKWRQTRRRCCPDRRQPRRTS
jgi:hypothetical protein